jgi:hypothetical protein
VRPVPDHRKHCACRAARAIATSLALAACCMIGGCNIVGPIAAIATPPPKVQALYDLQDVPTVVFVDDRDNLVSPSSLRRVVADTASSQLMANEAVSMTITPQDAMLIASRSDRNNALMDIEAIGRAVGAHQIIYVRITQFSATEDGYTPVPVAAATVKVIDVVSGTRVFPGSEMPDGYPVRTTGKPVDPSMYSTRTTRLKLYESLAAGLGDEIAKIFYTHDLQELGKNLR